MSSLRVAILRDYAEVLSLDRAHTKYRSAIHEIHTTLPTQALIDAYLSLCYVSQQQAFAFIDGTFFSVICSHWVNVEVQL